MNVLDLLADWERKNGTIAAILTEEWDDLRLPVVDASLYESPRQTQNKVRALTDECERLCEALEQINASLRPLDWDTLYAAWRKIGADTAGLSWLDFVAAVETDENSPPLTFDPK
jgi:hypothetical protein